MTTRETVTADHAMAMTGWTGGRRAAAALLAATAALVAAAVVLLGAGGSGGHGTAAHVVAVPGGLLRVEGVTPVARMKMGGMPMPSGPNVKDVPKGFRRFTVAVTLVAQDDQGMHVTPDLFRVRAAGTASRAPIDDDRDDVYVPRGAAYPRELTFDVRSTATSAKLTMRGGERPVVLPLGRATAGREDHAHGQG